MSVLGYSWRLPATDGYSTASIDRELFAGFKADATFFMNFGHNMVPEGQAGNAGFGQVRNMVDPQLGYTHKNALNVAATNPFFGLPTTVMPGQLRGQRTVPLSTLLRPYPQYGDLTETFMPGVDNRYKAIQLPAGVTLRYTAERKGSRTHACHRTPSPWRVLLDRTGHHRSRRRQDDEKGRYTEWKNGDSAIGGMIEMTEEWGGAAPHWMPYFLVADCDATAAQAQQAGGSALVAPKEIPGVGRFAVLADPQGTVFSVIRLDSAM